MARKNALTPLQKKKIALAMVQARRLEEARDLFMQICVTDKQDADAWFMLGGINGMLGRHVEALECAKKAIRLAPQHAQAHYNAGIALRAQRNYAGAVGYFQAALRIKPDYADAQDSLAHAYLALGRLAEAAETFRSALKVYPQKPELHSNLGSVYQALGRLTDAEACYREALRLRPGIEIAYENLGSVLCAQGRADEGVNCFRTGLRNNPRDERAHSNLLLTLNYLPELDQVTVLREHLAWGTAHRLAAASIQVYANSRDPERRLRVGYVSQDFRAHSVAYFIEPLLRAHNPDVVETFCYANVPHPDATTTRLQSIAGHWRDIYGLPDEHVANHIRNDNIDILVDLAGHTGGNRLNVFLYKPAPVQVTYLGYPNTTGLSEIDYRLTDSQADPDGQDRFYTEKLVRLNRCFLCYQPMEGAPPVAPPPAEERGYITFGTFNNLAKINKHVIRVWSEIMRAVPNSRLMIKNHSLTDIPTRERYLGMFAEQGIDHARIELLGNIPDTREHLELYAKLDIALDTFPYNGTTTTCEALWMGVPVITLAGRTHAGRVGCSLLTAVGLFECIAKDAKEYVEITVALAEDRNHLADLRATMRERVRQSPLCDAFSFAREVEAAFRTMWCRWCRQEDVIVSN
jgi:protein O-GlcNAc transferase